MSPVRASLVYRDAVADTTPPAAVTDLFLVSSNGVDDLLFATDSMPGDNGASGGRPHMYEFRSSVSPIATEGDWSASSATSWVNSAGGGIVGEYFEMYLTSQPTGTRYYHVRFSDLAGNIGAISNGVQVTLT